MLSSCAISQSANELLRRSMNRDICLGKVAISVKSNSGSIIRINLLAIQRINLLAIQQLLWSVTIFRNGMKLTRCQSTVSSRVARMPFLCKSEIFNVSLFLRLSFFFRGEPVRFVNKAINFRLTSDSFWVFFLCLSSKKHREWHATRLIVNKFA